MSDLTLGSLVAEVDGDDPEAVPVVFVHGLGGNSCSFEPLLAALGERRALRVDLPDAGRSAARSGVGGSAAIGALAGVVLDAVRAAGIERAHLVGHSMGTLVCRELARRAPERVASLVLYGALSVPSPAARQALRARAAQARRGDLAGVASAVAAGGVAPTAHPAAHAFVRQSVLQQDPRGYAAHCEWLADTVGVDGAASGVPVTLVTGEDDRVAPPATADALAGTLREAGAEVRVTRLPGVGHWPMIEAPGPSGDALVEHLDRAEGGR